MQRLASTTLALLATTAWSACSCLHSPGGTSSGSTGKITSSGSGGGGTSGGSGNGGNGAGSNGSSSGGAAGTLSFKPSSATLVLTGSAPQTASFTLELTDASGAVSQVTADSVAFDRPDLATLAAGEPVTATAPSAAGLYAGTGTLHAIYKGNSATATLTVQVQLVDYGPGLGATSPPVVALGAPGLPADPAAAITPLLYPYDGTVWPLGLTSPLVMWNAPQAGDVYRLHYSEANYSFDGYYTLASLPGQLRLAQGDWDRLTASNDASAGPDPLAFSLSRFDEPTQKAYLTAQESWTIAPASLRGAIYYWTISSDNGVENGHITRFQPGTGAQPQILNNGLCMGCHAVSANGLVLVADIDNGADPADTPYGSGSGTRPWAAFSLANAADAGASLTLTTTKYGADLALNPDGKYVVFGGPTPVATGTGNIGSPPIAGSKYISLGEVASGNVVAASGLDQVAVDPGMGLMMPAFSPDGTKVAVVEAQFYADNVLPAAANSAQAVSEYIATLDFDETGPTFAPTLTKIASGSDPAFDAGTGLAYPSFTPDSSAVAFHAGTTTTGCAGSCDDFELDDGNLFLVTLPGGAPIRLAAACDPPNPADANASVEPTFNPQQRGGHSWVVFTSMRDWGNQPWPAEVANLAHVNGKRRLWAAAVDAKIGTADPSHPAFYLEGQEDTPNMRGFWTLAPCLASASFEGSAADGGGPACTEGFQCCSGFCVNGQCVAVGQVSCAGVGGSCSASSDCCNSPTVSCQSGVCVAGFE